MYLDADGAQSLLFGLPHLHATQVQCTSQSWMLQMVLQYLRLLLKTEPQQTLTQNKQNQKWKVPHISFPSKFGIISQMITFWQAITRNSQDKVSQYIVRSLIQCDIKHANILCQPPTQAFLGELVFHPSPTNGCPMENNFPFPSLANHTVLSKIWKVDLDRRVTC